MKPGMQQGIRDAEFSEAYIALRRAEERIYSDEEVMQLPLSNPAHVHSREWNLRKVNAERFRTYLQKKNKELKVLDVGCGNGWLTNLLSSIPRIHITGTDINLAELEQARRLFGTGTSKRFVYGDIRSGILEPKMFDIIYFAASIQYFESFHAVISAALRLLKPGGEVHLMDSIFYQPPEVEKARYRSKIYFELKGHQSMQQYYFHHSLEDLEPFNHQFLHHPGRLISRINARNNPFFWIRIIK